MRAVLLLLCGLLLGLGAAARAQGIPACTTAQDGAVACLSGKLCVCRFIRGGSITGQRDRQSWDCGILRPACGDSAPPATIPNPSGPLLPGFAAPNLLIRPDLSTTPGRQPVGK